MDMNGPIFIGTDSGATTSKTSGVRADASLICEELFQRPTNSVMGAAAVIDGWISGVDLFLDHNGLSWDQVQGVGLAIPGPRESYGVLGDSPNMPDALTGWDFHSDYSAALAAKAGRAIPLAVGNDGNFGGVAEAQRVRGDGTGSVVMLAPGSGMGAAYVDSNGLPLDGDSLTGMEGGHLPAPLHLLDDVKAYPCGCGRTWGCFEMYSSLAGLPVLLEEKLKKYPEHPLAQSSLPPKEKALSLRGLAQEGDVLALELFDFQARAVGLLVATLAMALDPEYFVIGGGLIDEEATTESFRDSYLGQIRKTADAYFWPNQREKIKVIPASLGELSQGVGAALVALYKFGPKAKTA